MTDATTLSIADIDMPALCRWQGRSQTVEDVIRPFPAQALHATLDLPSDPPREGDALPPFWRWLYFNQAVRRSDLGRDGHPAKGIGLTPPVPLPRRMWAGGRLQFLRPLMIGSAVSLTSIIAAITAKQGRSGPLIFLTLRHEVHDEAGLVEVEEQDIVYREDPRPDAPKPPTPQARDTGIWSRPWMLDETALFRYSALTFNGHRIHYDLDYAKRVEGYEGLVVHGPLLATLMLELLREFGPDRRITHFAFRAAAPVMHFEPFEICGEPTREGADVWVRAPRGNGLGRLAMSGSVRFE
ncbi:MAG: MaoC family dehydratase N-terminal domain-containing protein [Neomegalonema sp.]|nr:MaoC family dehydratase N-terminal domain-containing protein [Neomegalonema sp.]